MRKPLHADQVDRYHRDGVLFPIPVLDEGEVRCYRSAIEEVEALNGGRLKRLDNAHRFFPWAYRLATHDGVVDAVASILGDDLLIDGTLVLCKYPDDPSYVSWHQDSVYSEWHLSPMTSAWIALSASTARSGCMRVIPGSHARGLVDHEEVRDQNNLLRRGERIGVAVDESRAIDLELRPGEMSLHHCNIIHGSNPNRTDDKRIGVIVRFVTSRIKGKGRQLMRVRGTSAGRQPEMVGAPAESNPGAAFAAWKEFDRQRQPS
jgi:ectoine hydroxylase-related dioxygenase (phytanoyl-CoA dioxygenase family)